MMEGAWEILYTVSVVAVPVILAITFHEAAHGYVANWLGDDTAKRMGRVSFNPLRHIDRFGTIVLPGLLLLLKAPFIFGYAKPVPVDFSRLHQPRRDMVWVALAGPGTNLALALAAGIAAHLLPLFSGGMAEWVADTLQFTILINLLLAVFNMIPVPPLDGGRVAVGLLPDALAMPLARLERLGIFIVLGLLVLPPLLLQPMGIGFNLFVQVIWPVVDFLYSFVVTVTGH